MKYTLDIDIEMPQAKVIEYFDNPNNLAKWQLGFIRMKQISSEPGQTGAKSKLYYKDRQVGCGDDRNHHSAQPA